MEDLVAVSSKPTAWELLMDFQGQLRTVRGQVAYNDPKSESNVKQMDRRLEANVLVSTKKGPLQGITIP